MAGIYIHIPFCRTRCSYCDFYKETNLNYVDKYLEYLYKEIELKSNFFPKNEKVETIYFGGGTPSVVPANQISQIIEKLYQTFQIVEKPEISFEANPDDINSRFASALATTRINRISMGVQSFNDEELRFFGRRHNSKQAEVAVDLLQKNGFDNISLDLIFGIPNSSLKSLENSLEKIVEQNIQHISIYDLIYEKGTKLEKDFKAGKVTQLNEDLNSDQYHFLVDYLCKNGFEQYEISNFCQPNYQSKHNSSYWNMQNRYLGLGPAAHSYNVHERIWNVSNLFDYFNLIDAGKPFYDSEVNDEKSRYNEYILTGLRTKKGISLDFIQEHFAKYAQKFISKIEIILPKYSKYMTQSGDNFSLSSQGFFISDEIIVELME